MYETLTSILSLNPFKSAWKPALHCTVTGVQEKRQKQCHCPNMHGPDCVMLRSGFCSSLKCFNECAD